MGLQVVSHPRLNSFIRMKLFIPYVFALAASKAEPPKASSDSFKCPVNLRDDPLCWDYIVDNPNDCTRFGVQCAGSCCKVLKECPFKDESETCREFIKNTPGDCEKEET